MQRDVANARDGLQGQQVSEVLMQVALAAATIPNGGCDGGMGADSETHDTG